MHELPDQEWYADHVLARTEPGAPKSLPRGPAGRWQRWWDVQAGTDALPRLAARQGFVLSTGELQAAGVTRAASRHAVARGRWTAPQRGFVSPVLLADGADRHVVRRRVHAVAASAATLSRPGLVVSGRSAAVQRGLPTRAVPLRPELTVASAGPGVDRLGRHPSRHTYGAGLAPTAVGLWFGVACTTVARTLVDLARHDRRDGLMAADAALHEDLLDRRAIDTELDDAVGWPGVRQARDVLALASGLAESPLESLVRLALHDSGFPPPSLQVELGGFRVDLCWPERRVVVQVDGLAKYSDETWRAEKRREQILRALGYRVERVTWDDLLHRWPATVTRLRRELHL